MPDALVVRCGCKSAPEERLAISEADIKLLWGRAGGMCSRPGCGIDLTSLPEGRDAYTVGEMAHVIARSATGPRGDGKGGDNTYANLVLLCPTDHRHVDKAPEGEFSAEVLLGWKEAHERRVRSLGSERRFDSVANLSKAVRLLLSKNYAIWKAFGPMSDAATADPGSNAFAIWELRRADTIVPNNRTIMNLVEANEGLLDDEQVKAFADFRVHADAYEAHVNTPIDAYPTFPKNFEEAFSR